jgi:hypothetical protein
MVEFITCFVAIDNDGVAKYISHEMTGPRFPDHNQRDIYDLCLIMNSTTNNDLKYIDVFHVLDQAGRTVWKEGELQSMREDLTVTPVDHS